MLTKQYCTFKLSFSNNRLSNTGISYVMVTKFHICHCAAEPGLKDEVFLHLKCFDLTCFAAMIQIQLRLFGG